MIHENGFPISVHTKVISITLQITDSVYHTYLR